MSGVPVSECRACGRRTVDAVDEVCSLCTRAILSVCRLCKKKVNYRLWQGKSCFLCAERTLDMCILYASFERTRISSKTLRNAGVVENRFRAVWYGRKLEKP